MSLSTHAICLAGVLSIAAVSTTANAHDRSQTHRSTQADAYGDTHGATVKTRRGERGKRVRVRAPHTRVDVDTRRRVVRIRVPYFNQDIRW